MIYTSGAKFWEKWLKADELEKYELVKQLPFSNLADAILAKSYLEDLEEYLNEVQD